MVRLGVASAGADPGATNAGPRLLIVGEAGASYCALGESRVAISVASTAMPANDLPSSSNSLLTAGKPRVIVVGWAIFKNQEMSVHGHQ